MIVLRLGSLLVAAFGVGIVLGAPRPIPNTGSGCAAVHIFSARGSGEPGLGNDGVLGKEGAMYTLAVLIRDKSKQTVTHSGIEYPASGNITPNTVFTAPPMTESVREGVLAVKAALQDQIKKCPNQKIVLLGYSQGAHVVGDALGGGGGKYTPIGYTLDFGPDTPPVSSDIGDKVAAIILYGDPRRRASDTFNKGTATRDGVFKRPEHQLLTDYADRIQSYCDSGDPFCNYVDVLFPVHFLYPLYNEDAAKFVVGKIDF